jgi:hypothetical protein
MIWLLATPFSLSRQQLVSLSQSSSVSPVVLTAGGGGRGADSYDREKTWPSINVLKISKVNLNFLLFTNFLTGGTS